MSVLSFRHYEAAWVADAAATGPICDVLLHPVQPWRRQAVIEPYLLAWDASWRRAAGDGVALGRY